MTRGSLDLHAGVLYVGHAAITAHVRAFDLDGRELEAGFSYRAPDGGRAAVDGLAVDADHRVWVADSASASLRCFTLFGAEVARADLFDGGGRDAKGSLGVPVDVATFGSDEEQVVIVASKGTRRHAVQLLPLSPAGGRTRSLKPMGDANGRFRGVSRVAVRGRFVHVCERGAGRVQVFRDGEFHFAFALDVPGGRFEPTAVAPLPDGRCVVAHGGERGGLALVDGAGRPLARLAEAGLGEGRVLEPGDVVIEPGPTDARTRLAVVDLGGDRVQVFNLEGRCYGAFPGLGAEPEHEQQPATRARGSHSARGR